MKRAGIADVLCVCVGSLRSLKCCPYCWLVCSYLIVEWPHCIALVVPVAGRRIDGNAAAAERIDHSTAGTFGGGEYSSNIAYEPAISEIVRLFGRGNDDDDNINRGGVDEDGDDDYDVEDRKMRTANGRPREAHRRNSSRDTKPRRCGGALGKLGQFCCARRRQCATQTQWTFKDTERTRTST